MSSQVQNHLMETVDDELRRTHLQLDSGGHAALQDFVIAGAEILESAGASESLLEEAERAVRRLVQELAIEAASSGPESVHGAILVTADLIRSAKAKISIFGLQPRLFIKVGSLTRILYSGV